MKVITELDKVDNLKMKRLNYDLLHTKYILLDELRNTAIKIRNDKNLLFKILKILGGRITLEMLEQGFEIASKEEFNLFDFSIDKIGEDKIRLEIKVDDVFFDIQFGVFSEFLGSKREFIKKIEKSIRNDYTRDYKIEVVQNGK